ncbi:MAG: hypothetical protein Q4C91_07740 [Eubacteriales bacterium]|nr:hypothetical protein [Eubacteriales bacterium]
MKIFEHEEILIRQRRKEEQASASPPSLEKLKFPVLTFFRPALQKH